MFAKLAGSKRNGKMNNKGDYMKKPFWLTVFLISAVIVSGIVFGMFIANEQVELVNTEFGTNYTAFQYLLARKEIGDIINIKYRGK
jgi:cytochrome b subunit of formate dehydrogenase